MRRSVRYRGRVQGVGFRATARGLAAGLAVTGWVMNQADGSVLLEAQGDEKAVLALLERIRQALGLLIETVDELAVPEVGGEVGFVIRR